MWVDDGFMEEDLCSFLTRMERKQITNRKNMKKEF